MAKATDRFITSTAAEVTPVSEIGPYEFTPGEVCRTLIADFTATVNPHTAAAEWDSYQKTRGSAGRSAPVSFPKPVLTRSIILTYLS